MKTNRTGNKFLYWMMLLCIFFSVSGCEKNEGKTGEAGGGGFPDGTPLKVEMDLENPTAGNDEATRARDEGNNLIFEDGDKMGLFGVNAAGNLVEGQANVMLVYSASERIWKGADANSHAVKFFAYFPYTPELDKASKPGDIKAYFDRKLHADMETKDKYRARDLIWTGTSPVIGTGISDAHPVLHLTMTHAYSKLVLRFDKNSIYYDSGGSYFLYTPETPPVNKVSQVKVSVAGKTCLPYRPLPGEDTYWLLADRKTEAVHNMEWTANFDASTYIGPIDDSAFKAGRYYTYKIGKGHKVKVGDIYCMDHVTAQGYIVSPFDYKPQPEREPIGVVCYVGRNPLFVNSTLPHGMAVGLWDAGQDVRVSRDLGVDGRKEALRNFKLQFPMPFRTPTTGWFVPSPVEILYVCSSHPTGVPYISTDTRDIVNRSLKLLIGADLLGSTVSDYWSNDNTSPRFRLNFLTGRTVVGGSDWEIIANVRTCFGF